MEATITSQEQFTPSFEGRAGGGATISISSLKKVYGEKIALDIEELKIQSGELVGLVGNNGAGKTTLLRLILDLIEATDGHVLSDDQDVAKSELWKHYTGSFIDGHFLIDFYTPEEYFTFIARLYGIKLMPFPGTVKVQLAVSFRIPVIHRNAIRISVIT
jgi:ABC-type multidrug transport system ATPase subunit